MSQDNGGWGSQDHGGWGFTPPDDPSTGPRQQGQSSPWGDPTSERRYASGADHPGADNQPGRDPHPGAAQPAIRLGARPGVIPLRPLTLGEIFDGGFQVMRRQPIPVFGSAGVVAAMAGLLTILTQVALFRAVGPAGTMTTAGLWAFGLTAVATVLLLLVMQALVTGVLVLPTARAATGHSSTFAGVWTEAARRILPLVGWPALQAVVATIAGAVLLGPALVLGIAVDPAFLALFLLTIPALIALSAWAVARFSFVPSVIMLEEVGLFPAIVRSYRLTKGVFWRVVGILLLTSIIAGAVSAVVQAPFSAIGGFLTGFAHAGTGEVPLTSLTMGAIGQVVGTMISIPFVACVTTLLYVDIRMRREGLHIELARAACR